MEHSEIQSLAITARVAAVVGAETFDRLFAGVHFDASNAPLLYVYVQDDETAEEVAEYHAHHMILAASGVLKRNIDIVLVLPSIFMID